MSTFMTMTATILWCGCSVAADPTAEQILEKSEAAYAALKSYEGTTTVNTAIDNGSVKIEQTATAKITFVRPGKIRIEGKTAGGKSPGLPEMPGRPYAIISDGKATWKSWALQDNGAFTKTNVLSASAA